MDFKIINSITPGNYGAHCFNTNFVDDINDCITVYAVDGHFTDDSYTSDQIGSMRGVDPDFNTMQKIAQRYGCNFTDGELISKDLSVLVQTILAIYAVVEFS